MSINQTGTQLVQPQYSADQSNSPKTENETEWNDKLSSNQADTNTIIKTPNDLIETIRKVSQPLADFLNSRGLTDGLFNQLKDSSKDQAGIAIMKLATLLTALDMNDDGQISLPEAEKLENLIKSGKKIEGSEKDIAKVLNENNSDNDSQGNVDGETETPTEEE